jgi:CheY-like chemotaxis protein
VCKITDTGIGIRKEDLAILFTEYHQVDSKANRKIEGTGLGLSIVRKMVKLMGGSISVESEYGKGSTFTLIIPQKRLNGETIGKDVAFNLSHMRHFQTKLARNSKLIRLRIPYARVLVVDDVQTNLDVAKGMLKPYEIQVDCVTSGRQAIDAMRDKSVKYNAIFMDHMMPGMDGIEATQHIRELGTEYARTIPIIALTANAIVGNEEMFLKNGFQAFLSKPIDIMRLDLEIRRWLRDKSQETGSLAGQISSPSAANAESVVNSDIHSWEIEGLDKRKALTQFGGSNETLLIVLHSYVDNTPDLLDKIRTCTEAQLQDYALLVHGIKGTTYGICADAVGKQAELLEHAARRGDFKFVSEHNDVLIEATETLIDRIRVTIQEIEHH